MAATYPEQVEEWEERLRRNRNRVARSKLSGEDAVPLEAWEEAVSLGDDLLGEVKAWQEQAAGHEASRKLLQERFDEQAEQLRRAESRLLELGERLL